MASNIDMEDSTEADAVAPNASSNEPLSSLGKTIPVGDGSDESAESTSDESAGEEENPPAIPRTPVRPDRMVSLSSEAASAPTAASLSVLKDQYDKSTVLLWEHMYRLFLPRLSKIDSLQIAPILYEDQLITRAQFSTVQLNKQSKTVEDQAEFLFGILEYGDNKSFDAFLSILYKSKNPNYRRLAEDMNAEANRSIPARGQVFQLDTSVGYTDELSYESIILAKDPAPSARVLFNHRKALCGIELETLLHDFNFGFPEGKSNAKTVIEDNSISNAVKRVKLVQLLVKVPKCDIEAVCRLLLKQKQAKLSKLANEMKEEHKRLRRADLPLWRVVPMFYANWKPKVTLKFANGQPYLEETPTLQCNTQSRAILEDYFNDTKGDLNENRGEEKDGTLKRDVQNVDRTQPVSTREQDLKLQKPKKNTAATAATPDMEFNPYDPDVFGPDRSNQKEVIDPKQQRLIVDKAFERLSKDHPESSKLEAVAIIGSSETSRRYCRHYLSMVDDLEEIWRNLERRNNDTSSNGDSCTTSSVHIVLEKSTCRCIFVVQLHPADTHATHQRLLRKVMLGCQSINILYGPAEVLKEDWLATPFLDFGRMAGMITADKKYWQGQCPEECKVQQNILATLREVLGVFPICPFYATVKVPLLLLWQSVFQNTWKKSTSDDRIKTLFKIFDIQRGPHAGHLEFKTEADKIYRSQQQLPLVAVDSGNMSYCHPHKLCKAVQTPRNLWLQDMTEDSPITLLASTNKSVLVQIAQDASQGAMCKNSVKKCNVCTAFPASLDTQADQMSSKMIDCFWRIEPLNQLNSLKAWNCPVLVITCISETRAQAFNCLNYIAGGSYPTEEDIIMKATDDEGVQHPISRLMACTRYAEGRLYVMLALPGITAGTFCSTSGLEEGQRNLVLSAISLSNIFVLDTSAYPKETIKGFTKAVHELLVMSQLVDGLQINRAKVDENLFCGNLAVLSTSSLNKECFDQNIHIDDVSCEEVLLAAFPKGIACHVYTQRRRSAAKAAPRNAEKVDAMSSEPEGYLQGRSVVHLLSDLQNKSSFPKGQLFVRTLNLVLALASTDFSLANMQPVADIYRSHTLQLEENLRKVLVYGDNDQKRGSEQLIKHIYRKETGEFPVSDVILDNGESTVNLIQEIRNGLISKFGQKSTICAIFNIKTHVQNCLQKLVDHRCEDAGRYLNGQIETGDYVDVDKGDFQKIIETFRKRWTLCGVRNASKRCAKCHYCCLLVDGHATSDLPHNCLDPNDKHLCVKQCELEVRSGTNLNKCFRQCAEQAGHTEVDSTDIGRLHKCEKIGEQDVHMCRKPCDFRESPSCDESGVCVQFIGHSEDKNCRCSKSPDEHRCPQVCVLAGNPICQEDESPMGYSAASEFESIGTQGSAKKRKHPLCSKALMPKGHTHLCGFDHHCTSLCKNNDGVCMLCREDDVVPAGAELMSGQDGYRLLCHERIASDQTVHDPGHSCCKNHRCAIKCPLCDCHCTKEYGHDGLHTMEEHGLAINSSHLLVLEGEELKPISDSTSSTCHDICLKAGRGHVHLTPNSRTSHWSTGSEMLENHDEFWARFEFSKPCSDPQFIKCAAKCHDDSHNDEHAVFCLRDVLHRPITDAIPAGGYVSLERDANSGTLPGHHFKCEPSEDSSHRCYSQCKQESYGKRCSSRCDKNLSHTGDDCHCGKFHSCGKTCSVSKLSRDMVHKCSNVCEKSSEEKNHDCFCKDTICHASCNIQGCTKPCALHHTHDGDEHDCGGDHVCIELCGEDGRCVAEVPVDNSKHRALSEAEDTRTSGTRNAKDYCRTLLKSPRRSHSPPHKCSGKHFCKDQCKSCSRYCTLKPNHSDQCHETEHGQIQDEYRLMVFTAKKTPVTPEDSATCSSLCNKAGPGHIHVLSPCSKPNSCESDIDNMVRHVTIARKKDREHVHVTTHVNIWKEMNFKDPYPIDKITQFKSCPVTCPREHETEQDRPQCAGDMWHASFPKNLSGSLFLDEDVWTYQRHGRSKPKVYHFFADDRHNCGKDCEVLDYGEKCQGKCGEVADHTCSRNCKQGCRGVDDPTKSHKAGPAIHYCKKKHHCKKMCAVGGICFRKTVIGTAPSNGKVYPGNGNAYKLCCNIDIPAGHRDHVQKDHECGKEEHTCVKFCRLCGQYCFLPHEHIGPCKTDHGVVIKSQLATLKVWTVDNTVVSWEDCDGMTCAQLCNHADPSHSHEIKCACTYFKGVKEFHHHSISSKMDHISHDYYWRNIIGFLDPQPDPSLAIAFSRCPVSCGYSAEEHEGSHGRGSFCDAGLFHPKLKAADYQSKPGYFSEGMLHHFPCRHQCSRRCSSMDMGESCKERCKLDVDHRSIQNGDGVCVCNKPKHACGTECQSRNCKEPCQEEWSRDGNKHTHWCGSNDNCGGTCEFENCKRKCALDHIHVGKSCDCNEGHRCPGKCKKDGLCSTMFSTESGLKLPIEIRGECEVPISPGSDSHDGECDCKKQHTCSTQCPLCKQYCSLGYRHNAKRHNAERHNAERHKTDHGIVVRAQDRTILGADESAVSLPDDVTCSELCATAGIGHTHILDHDSLHLVCSNDRRKCRPLNGKTSHHATHVYFWASLGFVDPSEESLKEKFRGCNVVCDRHSPSNSSPVYCTGEQWHDSYRGETVTQFTTGYVGNIQGTSSFGHHFKCSNHLCEEPCDLVHPGGVGEGSNHKCGLPLGHDCTDSCKLSCKGGQSAGHCSGSSKHCCDTTHKCQEMCKGSDGHCKPVAEAGYTGTLRLACAKEIPALKWRHGGIHHHKKEGFANSSNDGVHFCTEKCPRCHMTCSKVYGHGGNHVTKHGVAVKADKDAADPWKVLNSCQEDVGVTTSRETCSDMCKLAGPGHRHVLDRGSEHISHVEFWKHVRFDDPYSSEKLMFNKCSKPCDHCDHRHKESVLCERDLFHDKQFNGPAPQGSRLSASGCLLKCEHLCGEECAFQEGSKHCLKKCSLQYQHTELHKCSVGDHFCKGQCDKCNSDCIEVLDNPAVPHNNHRCDEHKVCGKSCGFRFKEQQESCTKKCTKHHRHSQEHSCGENHTCRALCSKEGICPGVLVSVQSSSASKGPVKLQCIEDANHGDVHTCGSDHQCSLKCPQCGAGCSLPSNHKEDHNITHGIVKAGTAVSVYGRQARITLAQDMKCHRICEKADRGHYHTIVCPSECTGEGYLRPGIEHHINARHGVTHGEFWHRLQIPDPCAGVLEARRLLGFNGCDAHCHVSCPGVRCSLGLFHNAPAKSDEVYSLNSHYYPECRRKCTLNCNQHRNAKCLRLLNHKGRHACSLDYTPSVSTGASNVPTRTQRCLKICPLCSIQCSLSTGHGGCHKCKHGSVVQEKAIYHVAIGTFFNTTKAIDTTGKTCSTMCTGIFEDHHHVYKTCGGRRDVCVNNGGPAASGVSHHSNIGKDVCSHQDFWRLHNFALS